MTAPTPGSVWVGRGTSADIGPTEMDGLAEVTRTGPARVPPESSAEPGVRCVTIWNGAGAGIPALRGTTQRYPTNVRLTGAARNVLSAPRGDRRAGRTSLAVRR